MSGLIEVIRSKRVSGYRMVEVKGHACIGIHISIAIVARPNWILR